MNKWNNKGLSLVELLVALAVSSIIVIAVLVLITQGMKSYQKQTALAQLQEDADIAMNQISDAIMEGNMIEISNYTSDLKITESCQLTTNQCYYYESDKQLLLVGGTGSTAEKSILCQNVTDFKVQIIRSSVETELLTHGEWIKQINNPVQIKVTLEVSSGGITRSISRVTGMRNSISDITLQSFAITGFPDSDVLSECEFLTN